MHYTEPIYKLNNNELMCRILDNVSIMTESNKVEDGVLTVGTDGIRMVYTREFFDSNFYLFDAGESPASIMRQKDENGEH